MFTAGGPGFWELAEQALSSTERGYDLLAAKFDWTPFRTPDAIVLGTEQYLRAGPPPRSSIDLCCGTGVGLEMLRRRTLERLVGVDFSRNMLEQARRRLESVSAARGEPHPQLELIRGDVLELGDRTELHSRFDVATCFGALGHIREVDSVPFFRGVLRCLVPGGRLVLVTFDHPKPWHPAWLFSRAYNGLTHIRNYVRSPQFHMYYLTHTWPRLGQHLRAAGFDVSTPKQAFAPPFQAGRLVVATRPTDASQSDNPPSSLV
ncbi:MAG: class I SAM-dependent methyltransferase [Polyangiaceae bacterium]